MGCFASNHSAEGGLPPALFLHHYTGITQKDGRMARNNYGFEKRQKEIAKKKKKEEKRQRKLDRKNAKSEENSELSQEQPAEDVPEDAPET